MLCYTTVADLQPQNASQTCTVDQLCSAYSTVIQQSINQALVDLGLLELSYVNWFVKWWSLTKIFCHFQRGRVHQGFFFLAEITSHKNVSKRLSWKYRSASKDKKTPHMHTWVQNKNSAPSQGAGVSKKTAFPLLTIKKNIRCSDKNKRTQPPISMLCMKWV